MDHFRYQDGQLYCEDVNVDELAAQIGTPFYLYSKATFEDHYDRFFNAFRELNPLVCYSIKNCGNIHVIDLLVSRGAGIDVVTGGELYRALKGGADASKVVFAGVGKSSSEIRQALEVGVGWLNVESEEECDSIRAIAADVGCTARVALRVNPDVYDAKTHKECATGKADSKFGVDIGRAVQFFETYGNDPHLDLKGIHIHLGSPIHTSAPYVEAITKVLNLVEELAAAGHRIEMLDIGGGYAAHYDGREEARTWDHYASDIVPLLRGFVEQGGQFVIEPGRAISANAGVLISRVQYVKVGVNKRFAILDTGMGHLIRPVLYGAYHFIWPTSVSAEYVPKNRSLDPGVHGLETYDVVGPICEPSDYLARDRALPPVHRGDLLCVFTAGAYGMTMASQYNAIPRPKEVLVESRSAKVIRRGESYDDLIEPELEAHEIDLP